MGTPVKQLFVFLLASQIGLSISSASELLLDEFLDLLQLAQAEITSGDLKVIRKLDTLPAKSNEEANAEAAVVILKMEERFSELPAEVQERPRYRRIHNRNIQLARKYMPEWLSGEQHLREEWSLVFEVAYFSAESKKPIFAHRFIRKNIKEYDDPDAADFYNEGLTDYIIFDGQRAVSSIEAPPNVINAPEQPPGAPEDFVYKIRQLIGRCIETSLQKQDIEIFAPINDNQHEYVLGFRIGREKQILKKVLIEIDKGFGVQRIEYFSPPDAAHPYSVTEFLKYKSSSGIWYPRKIKRVNYRIKENTSQIVNTETWEIKSAKFNISFPADYFRIPEKLIQSLPNTSYVAGE